MRTSTLRGAAVLFAVFACIWSAGAAGLGMVVGPYLNQPTQHGMVVRWETDAPATSLVRWGRKVPLAEETGAEGLRTLHEVALAGLEPGTPYFYQTVSRDDAGNETASEVYTFGTAVDRDGAFGFVVLSDTQENPVTLRALATYAYGQRPSFTLLSGDLVGDGNDKAQYTEHLFPNMAPLNTRVPLVPILGNHDNNSKYYYGYFSAPEPKYYFQFDYGNLAVFMVDSQKPLRSSSETHQWLDKALGKSKATWKMVMLHRPPYSSDEDDYGDTGKGPSIMGDANVRALAPLCEKHRVDVVWAGHIHSYERTWPLRDGKPVSAKKGVLYMVTGGGGGGLEKAAPVRTPLSAKVYSGHHYCYVMVNGKTLRIEAYDIDNHLFDFVELAK
jgi:predicted phosphodiesterase